MPTFFITFGTNHINPVTGESLFKHFVSIPADNASHARRIVNHRLDGKWSSLYDSEQFAGQVDKYDLTEWVWEYPNSEEGRAPTND